MTAPDPTLKATRPEFRLGEGKISGVLSVLLGWLGLGGVVTLHFPEFLSDPALRSAYPMPVMRGLLEAVLLGALGFGLLSLILGARKSRGLLGTGLASLALLLGGWGVPLPARLPEAPTVALDWFLVSLVAFALVFVPLELLWPRVQKQRIFRKGWRTDLVYFGVSHLLVQVTVFLTILPATLFLRWAVSDDFQRAVQSQPLWLQFLQAMLAADLFAYAVHRMFHEVPFLWRFHQVHHSSEEMDWLAGSRLHIVDIVVTRAFAFIPLYIIGFSRTAIVAYLAWASFHAVLIHSNLRTRFGWLRHLLATPQFHHWHHSATLYNRNFAVHFPFIDRLFGTHHLPGEAWPEQYGIEGGQVPDGFMRQLVYPLQDQAAATPGADSPGGGSTVT